MRVMSVLVGPDVAESFPRCGRPVNVVVGTRRARDLGDEPGRQIDIHTQISAAQSALDKVALGLLDDHAHHCVGDAARMTS